MPNSIVFDNPIKGECSGFFNWMWSGNRFEGIECSGLFNRMWIWEVIQRLHEKSLSGPTIKTAMFPTGRNERSSWRIILNRHSQPWIHRWPNWGLIKSTLTTLNPEIDLAEVPLGKWVVVIRRRLEIYIRKLLLVLLCLHLVSQALGILYRL